MKQGNIGMGLSVYLLGTPRIEREGTTVHVDTRKAIALVACLAAQEGFQSRDTLCTLLWPENDQRGARGALRRTLSVLHKALGGTGLHIEREALALNQAELWCDLIAFHRALAACGSHGHASQEVCDRCLAPLIEALSLYRGDFLQGFTLRDSAEFDRWQFQQGEYVRRWYAEALEKLAHLHAEQHQYPAALEVAQRWLALDPLHEPAHRQVIQLYAWSGQRSLALQQYRECVRILDQELGVPPLEETTRLYQAIMENKLTSVVAPVRSALSPLNDSAAAPDARLPLVGRAAELRHLVGSYRQLEAQRKAGRLMIIEGEAGIGKTRLTDEFLAKIAAEGIQTVVVRCYESESNLAYAPLLRTLRAALTQDDRLAHSPDHWLSELLRLLPELLAIRPDLSPMVAAESASAQSRLFEAMSQLLFRLLEGDRPGILLFEDAQWADHASLDLLAYLLRRLIEVHCGVLLTWRTEDVPRTHRLQTMLLDYIRIGGEATVLRLPRLELQAVRELIEALHVENGKEQADHLYRESEGLPLFLAEYMRLLRSDVPPRSATGGSLPLGIQDLLRSRLTALSETARQLLGAAAVIGRSFDVDLLRESSGRSEEEAVDGLDELLRRALIQDSGGNSPAYEFYHEKLRALIYQEMSMARRRLLHRRTAQALLGHARYTAQVAAFSAQIAYHFQHSGQERDAAEYFYQAGTHTRGLFANREALLYFESALGLNYSDTAALYQNIGDLHTLLGDYDAAIRAYESAMARCPTEQLPHLEHCLARVYHRLGEWELAESYYHAAFDGVPETHVSQRAAVLTDWSLTAYNRSEIARALELAQTAFVIADKADDPYARAQAHNIMGILARGQGDLDTARAHLTCSMDIARSLDEIGMHIAVLNNLALTLADSQQFEQAQQLWEDALERCERLGDRHHEAALHNNLADLFHLTKRPELAMTHLKQAVSLFAQIGIEGGAMKPEIWKLAEW